MSALTPARSADSRYVLSTYLTPPGLPSLVASRHDLNVALWRIDGAVVELERLWELERFSGQKHHLEPLHSPARVRELLDALLGGVGLELRDIEAVYGTPGVDGHAPIAPSFPTDLPVHAVAHLFSALLLDTDIFRNETIIGLAIDGAPDLVLERCSKQTYYAACVSRRGKVEMFPTESPAPIFSAARTRFGSEPGTLMALATATPCRIDIDAADVLGDRTFWGTEVAPNARAMVDELIDIATASLDSATAKVRHGASPTFTDEENLQSAVMKVVHDVAALVMRRNIDRIVEDHGVDTSTSYLALAGGFALNCPTNSMLVTDYRFRGLLAPPCVNDSGQSLGIGLLALHGSGELDARRFRFPGAYLGDDELHIEDALRTWESFVKEVTPLDIDEVVDDLERGPLAWVQGAAEVGPRALGHRSLLGDPRTIATKDRLNEVKQRQWWRPVAPIVLEELAEDWFVDARRSPYMLETFLVYPTRRHQVPAILHLDDTARVQTLRRTDDELLHDVLTAFHRRTGVPIVGNTSLNDRGEPIVQTASQALNFCVRKGIEIAYLGDRRVHLDTARRSSPGAPTEPERRATALFSDQYHDRQQLWRECAARGLDGDVLVVLARIPQLWQLADSDEGVDRLREMAHTLIDRDPVARGRVDRLFSRYGPNAPPDDDGLAHDLSVEELHDLV